MKEEKTDNQLKERVENQDEANAKTLRLSDIRDQKLKELNRISFEDPDWISAMSNAVVKGDVAGSGDITTRVSVCELGVVTLHFKANVNSSLEIREPVNYSISLEDILDWDTDNIQVNRLDPVSRRKLDKTIANPSISSWFQDLSNLFIAVQHSKAYAPNYRHVKVRFCFDMTDPSRGLTDLWLEDTRVLANELPCDKALSNEIFSRNILPCI